MARKLIYGNVNNAPTYIDAQALESIGYLRWHVTVLMCDFRHQLKISRIILMLNKNFEF